MKRPLAFFVLVLLLCAMLPALNAQTAMNVAQSAYNLRVTSIDVRTIFHGKYTIVDRVASSGRKLGVNTIAYEYDFEEENAEFVGRFYEDAPVALVCVDGFSEEIAAIQEPDLVVITVNGQALKVEEGVKYADYIGWQNENKDGKFCVVFPIQLTQQGGEYEYTICVEALVNDTRVRETAQIAVKLINTHEYKKEKTASIATLQGENVDAYIVGERIYLDHPQTASGETSVTATFADEQGLPFACITWAEQTACEKEGQKAALYLESACKLEDSAAEYRLDSMAAPARYRKAVFHLETQDALYSTKEYTIVERFDVEVRDPKGVYFAQEEQTLAVGGAFEPIVMGVATGVPVRTNNAGRLELLAAENTAQQVIDVTDGKTVIATKPGVAYITARYTMGNTVYDASSMKIIVTDAEAAAYESYYVLCRNLHVRSAASLESEKTGMLHRGDEVQVVSIAKGWALTAQGDYVSARYLGSKP